MTSAQRKTLFELIRTQLEAGATICSQAEYGTLDHHVAACQLLGISGYNEELSLYIKEDMENQP